MGNSAVIVGDDSLIRVHIHTLDPGGLIAQATAYGTLQKLKVEDMTRQHHEILAHDPPAQDEDVASAAPPLGTNGYSRVPTGQVGVVAVAAGEGFRRIFEELGAGVVEGGQTMNPSTEDLLAAVTANGADEVIILPNNKNVIMTAQQVSSLSNKAIKVVASRTVPQGISALLNLDPGAGLEANSEAMASALKGVQTIEVTFAGPAPLLAPPPGVQVASAGPSALRFEVAGELGPLIAVLAEHPVATLTSRQPSLEEIFLHHYDSSDGDASGESGRGSGYGSPGVPAHPTPPQQFSG